MDDDSKMSFFFLGLGIGAAMGVLFAPKVRNRDSRFSHVQGQ